MTAQVSEIDVVVLGSANRDLVLSVQALPRPGETVLARSLRRNAGGKGANQAVAAARGGASTAFVGAVGTDPDGDLLAGALADAGVNLCRLRRSELPTGTALVVVDDNGENHIVVAPGANATMQALRAEDAAATRGAAVLLVQLEVPLSIVVEAAAVACDAGVRVVLNAAPASALPSALWPSLDVLVVNEHEAVAVSGGARGIDSAVTALLGRVPRVVVTLGAAGALVADRSGGRERIAAVAARVVDTTGAGDTFCGVFAAALAAGELVPDAVCLANAAASLSVETPGAVPSIPFLEAARQRCSAAYPHWSNR